MSGDRIAKRRQLLPASSPLLCSRAPRLGYVVEKLPASTRWHQPSEGKRFTSTEVPGRAVIRCVWTSCCSAPVVRSAYHLYRKTGDSASICMFSSKLKSAASKNLFVFGANGALASSIINSFKKSAYNVVGCDVRPCDALSNSVVIDPHSSLLNNYRSIEKVRNARKSSLFRLWGTPSSTRLLMCQACSSTVQQVLMSTLKWQTV